MPGRHRIDVEKSGFAPSFDPFTATTFDLKAGQSLSEVQIALKRGGVIAGGVRDETGEPQPDISVWAMRLLPQGRQFGLEMIQGGVGHTNDLGEFRIANLQEGEYLVVAAEHHHGSFRGNRPSRASAQAPTYYPGTTERALAQAVSIRAGQPVADLWFSVIASPAFTVSGEVVDTSGTRLRAAMVTLMPAFRLEVPPSTLVADTESDGSFQIGAVLPGTYHATAIAMSSSEGGSFGFAGGSVVVDSSGAVVSDTSAPQSVQVTVTDRDVSGLRVVAKAQ